MEHLPFISPTLALSTFQTGTSRPEVSICTWQIKKKPGSQTFKLFSLRRYFLTFINSS